MRSIASRIGKRTNIIKENFATIESIQEQYVVDDQGQKTAVILAIEDYEQLLEDLYDLAMVAERRSKTSIRLSEIKSIFA
ncbi:MAG: type II toxin-antitoxin system Phd/YefM family antitoxin [Cyanobacteria bacterium P01_G01_bin.54]